MSRTNAYDLYHAEISGEIQNV